MDNKNQEDAAIDRAGEDGEPQVASSRRRVAAATTIDLPVPLGESQKAPGSAARLPCPGDVLSGRYELTEVLGMGGMGAVFAAKHRGTGREVAIKVLLPQGSAAPHKPERLERFVREANVAGRIRHANVVDVYDVEASSDPAYIVMERLHGESLQHRIARGPMTKGEAIPIMIAAMRGVAEVHRQGVIHRDLKPDNIFLARTEGSSEVVPKVLDFGVSRIASREDTEPGSTTLTRTGCIVGTPSYMSLEQLRGEPKVDARADVYALGVILYEALCGERPFEARNDRDLVLRIATELPVPLSEKTPLVDDVLSSIVSRALSREAKDRFDDVEGFAAALERWWTGQHADGLAQVVSSDGGKRAPFVQTAVPRSERSDLQRKLPVRLSAVVALSVLVGYAVHLGSRSDPLANTRQTTAASAQCHLPTTPASQLRACISRKVMEVVVLSLRQNQEALPQTFAAEVGDRMLHEHTGLTEALSRANRFRPVLDDELVKARMPAILRYLALIESGYDPHARSPADAVGLWQFKPQIARRYGLRVDTDLDEREDPLKSTRAAARFLRDLAFEFGGDALLLALASYNLGEGRIREALQKLNDPFSDRSYFRLVEEDLIPKETQRYVTRFVAATVAGEAGLPAREALIEAGYGARK